MAVPVLMTLFTDDAVEVRYSDQSCLQLSPCGSTFVHHESPEQLVHQAHGMKTISQRCEFVTSDFRQKVLQALDFRNRFAERPFVCQSLIEEDQIVPLYARIYKAAWPKGLEQANFEYMPDGGVRLISEDEYSSLVLSPHRQDFTICYLCWVSHDSPRKKVSKHRKLKSLRKGCLKKNEENFERFHIQDNKKDNILHSEHISNGPWQGGNKASPERKENIKDDLNISPISLASTQMSRETSPINDSKAEINRYSTPTNLVQNHKTGRQTTDCDSLDGSFLQFTQKTSVDLRQPESADNTVCEVKSANISGNSKHSSDSDNSVSERHVHWISDGSDVSETGSIEDQSNSQILYSWVTRHYSSEECPTSLKHVLNLARGAIDIKQLEKYSSATSVHINQKPKGIPKKINPENYCMVPLPESLSLTCPGQHLHKQYGKYVFDESRDIVENITALSKGKLKIVLIDGVVFRIVRLATTKFVEIFPGDGSVILSEGLSGHFYRHIIPSSCQLDERTYSLKAPPPTTRSATYSIEKLIKRASRFLLQTNQEDKTLTERIACWKYKDNTLIEPLAASMLEECTVPGHGRFSAFSNGHVRILFKDRTSLDMPCDFTKRIMGCMEHSNDASEKALLQQQLEQLSHIESRSKQGLCKLLLPNGQYQIVDSKQPGIYRKYTDAALEWAAWVNSSPNQRKIFYQHWNKEDDATMMVTKELQKIKCFNYLVDNTLANTNETEWSVKHDTSTILEPQGANRQQYTSGLYGSTSTNIPYQDPGFTYSAKGHQHSHSYHPTEGPSMQSHHVFDHNPSKELELMRGFNSVREALLRTSSAIKDIDEILDKKDMKR